MVPDEIMLQQTITDRSDGLYDLGDWEQCFKSGLRKIEKPEKAGALLPLIPERARGENFLESVKSEWGEWEVGVYPCCLVILYGGLAFYEYVDNTFWPQFSKAVGRDSLPSNQQTDINQAFLNAARSFKLPILKRDDSTDYVGSAVYHIGIPLSLWDGFLDLCEWALWQNEWKTYSDEA
jgi:hypothetical protein